MLIFVSTLLKRHLPPFVTTVALKVELSGGFCSALLSQGDGHVHTPRQGLTRNPEVVKGSSSKNAKMPSLSLFLSAFPSPPPCGNRDIGDYLSVYCAYSQCKFLNAAMGCGYPLVTCDGYWGPYFVSWIERWLLFFSSYGHWQWQLQRDHANSVDK